MERARLEAARSGCSQTVAQTAAALGVQRAGGPCHGSGERALAAGEKGVGPQARERDPGVAPVPAKTSGQGEALAPGGPGDREIDVADRAQPRVPRVEARDRATRQDDPARPVPVLACDAVGQPLESAGPSAIPDRLWQGHVGAVEGQRVDLDPAGEQCSEVELKRQVSARGQNRPDRSAFGEVDIAEDDPWEREQHHLRRPLRGEGHAPALLQPPAHETGGRRCLDRPWQAGRHQHRGEKPESEG
ncbi:hypothetical protein GCM10025880_60560 [Methylorubrum aminovorans]|nr:hypothetical protein GCM10025880_60560 [Methylorubrum aminovorans]